MFLKLSLIWPHHEPLKESKAGRERLEYNYIWRDSLTLFIFAIVCWVLETIISNHFGDILQNVYKKVRNGNCHDHIWNQHEKCFKMSTNMPMFGPVVLEIACIFTYRALFFHWSVQLAYGVLTCYGWKSLDVLWYHGIHDMQYLPVWGWVLVVGRKKAGMT